MKTDATASPPLTFSLREAVGAHRVAADAGRQERADERADEEDPHQRRRAAAAARGSIVQSSTTQR